MKRKVLVTGSAGLIGSEAVRFFCDRGFEVVGVDNDSRSYFFGNSASTDWNRKLLLNQYKNYKHKNVDIRDEKGLDRIMKNGGFGLIIHTAA